MVRRCRDQRWTANGGGALAREHLDLLLVTKAAQMGTAVFSRTLRRAGGSPATATRPRSSRTRTANRRKLPRGSWLRPRLVEVANWPAAAARSASRADWLAFKAHFRQTNLPAGLMPCFASPAVMAEWSNVGEGESAVVLHSAAAIRAIGAAIRSSRGRNVLTHILESCPVLRPVLDGALLDGPWLSAGVIQPGIRRRYRRGRFIVGQCGG